LPNLLGSTGFTRTHLKYSAVMLSEELQRNAKHEARLSNISGLFLSGTAPELVRD
jgi:hypothetical protein